MTRHIAPAAGILLVSVLAVVAAAGQGALAALSLLLAALCGAVLVALGSETGPQRVPVPVRVKSSRHPLPRDRS